MIAISRVGSLPPDLSNLLDAATDESMRMVSRLAIEYESGVNSFDGPGEGLWEARSAARLIGICGLNVDPFTTANERCGRVRRLYVLPEWRRRGVASALLEALGAHAAGHFDKLTAFTVDPGVVRFYLARGFRPVTGMTKRSVERDLVGRS